MIELILGLAEQLLKYANIKEAKARSENIKNLRVALLNEKARGQLSDDGEIERLEKLIKIEAEALLNDLLSGSAKK